MKHWLSIFLLGLLVFPSGAWADEEVSGKPCIVDADTLAFGATRKHTKCIGGQVVDLWGVAGFKLKQQCKHPKGRAVMCGLYAAAQLQEKIKKADVRCVMKSVREDGTNTAECFLNGVSLNKYMVEKGYALAYRPDTERFRAYQALAENGKKGLWVTTFIEPWRIPDADTGQAILKTK